MELPSRTVVADPPIAPFTQNWPRLSAQSIRDEPNPVYPSRSQIPGWVAVAVWAILLLVINVRVILSPLRNSVLPIFTTASQRWLIGENLYGPMEQYDSFRYSPLVAVLLIPFGSLPIGVAGVIWRLANGFIFLGGLAWWLRAACPGPVSRGQRAFLFLLIIPLSAGSLNNGQCNPLVIGLLLATMAAVATERWNLAAGCVALACFFKLYPLAIGLLLVASYPRRFAPRLALALGIGFLLPFFLQRPDYVMEQYANWLHHLTTYDRGAMPLRLQYSDLRLLCRVWLWPIGPSAYLAAQLLGAAGCAALCVAVRTSAWPVRQQLALVLGLGCCWMLLLGPATESCTHILLAPSLAWALLESGDESRGLRLFWWFGYGLLLAAGISCWFPNGAILHDLAIQPLAVLVIFLSLVFQAGQRFWRSSALADGSNPPTPSVEINSDVLVMPAIREELARHLND
jgi:hypothetical protein